MRQDLTASGTCRYNGYTFSPAMQTISIRGEDVYDRAERTVIYKKWLISLKDRINMPADTANIETYMTLIRTALSLPGQAFYYNNKAFGDLSINTNGFGGTPVKWDAKFGPTPRGFDWQLLGGNRSCEFTWTVEIHVPEHCLNVAYQFAHMALNYAMDVSQDKNGYTTRTIKGYLEIPNTRIPGIAPPTPFDNVDFYLEHIVFQVPVGFRRTQSHSISEDKRVLDFSIVDEEMAVDLPDDCTEVSCSHELSNSKAGYGKWSGRISANYTLANGVDKSVMLDRFLVMALGRIDATKKNLNVKGATIPQNIVFSEDDIYGMRAGSASISYFFTIADADFLGNIFAALDASQLWKPLDTDWNRWKVTMDNAHMWDNGAMRGPAQIGIGSTEAVVDLCNQNSNVIMNGGRPQKRLVTLVAGVNTATMKAAFPHPDANNSWIGGEISLKGKVNARKQKLTPLPSSPPIPKYDANGSDLLPSYLQPQNLPGSQEIAGLLPSMVVDTIQNRASADLVVELSGILWRAGWNIGKPNLVSYGGQPAVPAGGEFATSIIANFNVPIVEAVFDLLYWIPNAAAAVTGSIPPNPALMVDKTDGPVQQGF